MHYFLVVYLSWTCPGGWFSGWVPTSLQPLVCEAGPEVETYDRLDRAMKRITDLGEDAELMECYGLRCKNRPIAWTPHL